MADVNANIGVNIDTSAALAQLKALQRQISQFHTSIAKSSETATLAQRDLQKNFLNGVNAIGAFSAELRTVKTTAESFTSSLEKNKFSMREYFRFAGGSTKTFGKLFKSEFDTIGKVAEDRVKKLQTQYIKLGRDTSGAMKAIAIMPNQLDMGNFSTQSQIAAQKQAIFNQLVKQGSTNLLNFGKNTQWAGRQLMVGFTLPLAALGATASRTFMDMEQATIKFRKVYGDLFTPETERQQALEDITQLGQAFTQYGISVSQTVGLASEAAAAGFAGLDLQRQTTQATRLSILGQVEAQKALETTISLQNAFKMSSEDLASSIDFLNAVENQTVVSLDDITTAIPKVAPVIEQLGGDVKDLAFFMAAMKEGGINASEGANALKSGLAALINPTEKASAMLAGYGININKIIEGNQGDLKTTVVEFAKALDTLDPLTRARAIEQLFGKFQFARLSTLFSNVINQTGQASRVLDLAGTSIEDLAALSESELGITADSAMNKFRKSIEDLKFALVPVGKVFLEAVTPLLEFAGSILEKFNNLSSGVKKALVVLTVAIGAIGPVALMTFGLLANGIANIVKGAMILRNGYLRLTGQSQILGEQTEYLTMEQIDAAAASHSLDQAHARLKQTFTAETVEITKLIAAYQAATTAGAKFAAINPGMMLPGAVKPTKRAKGKPVVVGGTGNQDTELALLTPGETVIPADMSKKYGALINGMIAGNIPGYQVGRGLPGATDFAHITDKAEVQIGSLLKMLESAPKTLSQSMMMLLKELATVFGEQLKVFIYSGLGFTQSKQLNIGMAGGKAVSAQDFLSDFEQQGLAKWNKSLSIAGVKTDAVAEELAVYDSKLQNAVRSMIDIDQNATITSDQFAAIEREVRNTLPEFSQLRQALDTAQQALTEVRFNINEQMATEAGLTPFQVPSKKFPGQMSKKKKVQLPSGKNIRLGGEHLVGRGAGGMGSIDASLLTQTAAQVTNQAVLATAQAAGTNSPSKKTIPIGEDIARGLQVGMANQQDEVAASGQALGTAAVGGTQSGGRQRRRATRPQGPAQQTPVASVISNTTSRLDSMNKALMGSTFALTSLAGAGSMASGPIGNLSQQVMKYSGLLFALMSVTQLLTQAKFAELVATRAKTVADAMGSKTVGGLFSKGGGLVGFGKNLMTAGKFALRFAGPIGLATTAIIGTISVIKMVNAARERERRTIMGLADAANMTAQKLETLGNIFGVQPRKNPLLETAPSIRMTTERRGKVEELKSSDAFQKDFADTISGLREATKKEAEITLKSISLALSGQGYTKAMIADVVDALREEAGKTDVKIDLKSLDLGTEAGQEGFAKLAADMTNELAVASKNGYKMQQVLVSGVAETGQRYSYYAQQLKPTVALQKAAATSGQTLFNMMTGLAGGLESGAINAKSFNQGFDQLQAQVKSFNAINPGSGLLMLKETIKLLNPETQKLFEGLEKDTDIMLMMRAQALGLTYVLPGLGEALKTINAGYQGNATELVLAQQRVKAYEETILKTAKITEDQIKKLLGGGTTPGDGKKSAFELAIEQLENQQKELKNTSTAYKLLIKEGLDAETALKYASDPVIALGLATKNLSTDKVKELVGLIAQIDPLLETDAVRDFFTALNAETQLKKDLATIVPEIKKMGGTVSDINNILQNKELVSYLTNPLLKAEERTARIKRYLDAIRAGKNIDIIIGITVDETKEELKKKAGDLFSFLERAAEREYKPKIIDKEKEVKDAQDAVDRVQKTIDDIQSGIDREQRKIEIDIARPIEQMQESINDIERQIEMQFGRRITELQEQSSDMSEDLAVMDKAAESITQKYDQQSQALSKISEINQTILDQQKRQVGLADALSQGDISAAAQAIQEMRSANAAKASKSQEDMLQVAKQAEIDALRSRTGLTRAQIAERQYQIEREIYALEEQREAQQARIQTIQDNIYNLEEEREKRLLAIRAEEDRIYNLKIGQLAENTKLLETAQKNLENIKAELQARLDNIGLQRDAFQATEDAEMAAKIAAGEYNDVITLTLGLLGQVEQKWKDISAAAKAAATGLEGGSLPGEDLTRYVAPLSTAADKIALEDFIDVVEELDAALAAVEAGTGGGQGADAAYDRLQARLAKAQAAYDAILPDSSIVGSSGGGSGGRFGMLSMSSGGMVKPKYFSVGGLSRGTDTIPAMLSPGEFVMSRYAVDNYGVDKMKSINNGTYEGQKVYNYNLSVNVKSDSNPDDIARVVIKQIQQLDNQRIRKQGN